MGEAFYHPVDTQGLSHGRIVLVSPYIVVISQVEVVDITQWIYTSYHMEEEV